MADTGENALKILITGICGFVGSTLARAMLERADGISIIGCDSLIRPGSQSNQQLIRSLGIPLLHADIRMASDFETIPAADWVIDCAAHASILAAVDGAITSRQLVEHNLIGTVNMLEFCRRNRAGLVLVSTSRVYSIAPLAGLSVTVANDAFVPDWSKAMPPGLSSAGVGESFSTQPPISLYGATKLASETLALEYGEAYGFPVYVNRCGVLAGAGQFGRPDQGIMAFWINAWLRKRPLRYIGFNGSGHQVRDLFHPRDLAQLFQRQMREDSPACGRVYNVGGGAGMSISLRQLSAWCANRFGARGVTPDPEPRPFDIPWMVMDSALAQKAWNWVPERSLDAILEEIAQHAEAHPDWLDISAPA